MTNYLYLNLKRFDVSKKRGGVNVDSDIKNWAKHIIDAVLPTLKEYKKRYDVEFVVYLPELHILNALEASDENLRIGCQGIHYEDVTPNGNFGAFTSHRLASSMEQVGVKDVIIGHFEERKAKQYLVDLGQTGDVTAVNQVLNQEISIATNVGLSVLYCIGESLEERNSSWQAALKTQIKEGLKGIDLTNVKIAYEPLWAIGPGKTPASDAQIKEVVQFIKSMVDVPVLYGGGLKSENAAVISGINEVDGGLIALTRFSGNIGFYPEEYLEIIRLYLESGHYSG